MIRIVLDTVALPTYAETFCRKKERDESAQTRSNDENVMVRREVNSLKMEHFTRNQDVLIKKSRQRPCNRLLGGQWSRSGKRPRDY